MPYDTAVALARVTHDTPPSPEPAIACVPWPSDADRRADLARAGVPRLLFVEPGAAPPELWDLDEDWVRVPASAEEVILRSNTLRSRLLARQEPPKRVIHTPS